MQGLRCNTKVVGCRHEGCEVRDRATEWDMKVLRATWNSVRSKDGHKGLTHDAEFRCQTWGSVDRCIPKTKRGPRTQRGPIAQGPSVTIRLWSEY